MLQQKLIALGLLRRNMKISSQAVKTQAYQSLVRPHLEYASTVWSLHTSDNIKKVEMVQRRAARYVCNRWHNTSSVSEMVSHLGWESLAVCRSNMRLHTMYRIVHTTMGDPWHMWLTLSTRQTRGFHLWRYIPLSLSNNPYKFSFLPCTIPVWNSLPLHVVSSQTLDSSRLRLNTMETAGFFNSPLFSLHNFCFAVTSCFLFRLQLTLSTPDSDT